MKKTIEEIRAEFLKDLEDGYIIPEKETAKFLSERTKARHFCEKKLKKHNYKLSGASFLISEYIVLCEEARLNLGFFWVMRDLFDLGYYRGYQRAMKEAREAKKKNG